MYESRKETKKKRYSTWIWGKVGDAKGKEAMKKESEAGSNREVYEGRKKTNKKKRKKKKGN